MEMAILPWRPPKSSTVKKTPKVCKVKGMTVGIEIHEQIAKSTAKIPA